MCSERCGPGWIDDGTMCRSASYSSGPTGLHKENSITVLNESLHALEATALNFGKAFINDASVRENYVHKIQSMSKEILRDVQAGRATPEEGARFAQQIRNRIMEEARTKSSPVGRAGSEKLKTGGKALEALIDEKTAKLFPNKSFADLTKAQRRQVFKAIIESSGKSRPSVTARMPRWRMVGRGLLLFTVAIATYNVWTAENKVHAGLKEGIVLGGGVVGGAVAGAATGLVCGPGAPICSTALFIVGGIMGALAFSTAADCYNAELLEFAEWLGEGF
jgi:hypothetical protein